MPIMNGSRLFLELLKLEGVTVLFGNPGTTELPLMDDFAREGDIRYILSLQEGVAMAMADGYARATGTLGVVNVHVAPGLGNAMGMLYDAQRAGAPLLVTAGQQAQGFGVTEPNLYADLPPIARPFVKWSAEVASIHDMPLMVRRAAKIALTPPTGPVFLSLPNDVMSAVADVELGQPNRIGTRIRADLDMIRQSATLLAGAERPMIIAGDAVSQADAHAELVELAELLGAPVYLEGEPTTNGFPLRHPLLRSRIGRIGAGIRKILEQHDVIFSAGADLFTLSLPSEVDLVPPGCRIIHLDNDPWQLGKNHHTDYALLGDAKATLPELAEEVRAAMSADRQGVARRRGELVARENAAGRDALRKKAQALSDRSPVAVVSAMLALGETLPENAVIVDETISSSEGLRDFLPFGGTDALYGVRGGGIGWGMPGAIGVQLAKPDRPVVALVGDGSAMYTIQALWTAAHERVPVTYVILNNRSYRVLKQRLSEMGGEASKRNTYVAMDLNDPPIDYVGLARSLGVSASRAATIAEFRAALAQALERREPSLIELMIDPSF